MKIQQMKNIFNKSINKRKYKKTKWLFQTYCKKLKEKFGDEESKYDENYADGTQILKHRNFKVLNNISYDKE